MTEQKLKTFFSRCVVFHLFIFTAVFSFSASLESLIEEGHEALNNKKEEVAEQKFSEAVSQYPQSAQAHFELGNLWMNQALAKANDDLLLKAVEELKQAVQNDAGLGRAQDDLAYCYFLLKDYEKSYEHYQMASRLGVRNLYLKERLPLHLHFHEKRLKAKEVKDAEAASYKKSLKTQTPHPSDDETGGGVGR